MVTSIMISVNVTAQVTLAEIYIYLYIYIYIYSSHSNRRDVTTINFLRVSHLQLRLSKIPQTSHHHAYSRYHVY